MDTSSDKAPELVTPEDPTLTTASLASAIAETEASHSSPDPQKQRKPLSPQQEAWKRFRRDKRAMISLGILLLLILLALIIPPIYQRIGGTYPGDLIESIGPETYHRYDHSELSQQHQMPSDRYWLGTDSAGRDILARLLQGILISMLVATAVEIVNIVLGITIGVLAGFYGGIIDQFLARFTDLMFAFPSLLFIVMLAGLFGPATDNLFNGVPLLGERGNGRLLLVSLAIALTSWPIMARYVRGQALQLREQQFIEAARTTGSSNFKIIRRHIIPNLFSLVFIASTLNVAGTIIGEAGISLLGLGVKDPGSSLGLMISDALEYTDTYPWEIIVPTTTLTIIVLAVSFLGDGLRDAFDPRSKD